MELAVNSKTTHGLAIYRMSRIGNLRSFNRRCLRKEQLDLDIFIVECLRCRHRNVVQLCGYLTRVSVIFTGERWLFFCELMGRINKLKQ
jgi:hypothetical protein